MTNESPAVDVRAALIGMVKRGQANEEAYRAQVSAAEREQTGTQEHWAPREVVAHLAFWKRRQIQRLVAVAHGEVAPAIEEFQQINDESWPDLAKLTWDEAVAQSDEATRELIAALQALPDEALADADDPASAASQLAGATLGNGPAHVSEHIAYYFLDHGDVDRAIDAMRENVTMAVEADAGTTPEAFARYNLACFLVTHGRPAEAMGELRQAFALHPDLIPWARDDHDLDSLRDDPQFQALVPAEA